MLQDNQKLSAHSNQTQTLKDTKSSQIKPVIIEETPWEVKSPKHASFSTPAPPLLCSVAVGAVGLKSDPKPLCNRVSSPPLYLHTKGALSAAME